MSLKDKIKSAWERAFGSKLRCKPGDVCLIVKQHQGRLVSGDLITLPARLGIVVRVVSHDGKTWKIEEPIEQVIDLGDYVVTVEIAGIADEFLQPLPKLDDPAEDESTGTGKPQSITTPEGVAA